MILKCSCIMIGLVLLLAGEGMVWSQTEREQELERTIQMLLKRVEVLEAKVETMSKTADTQIDSEEKKAEVAASPNDFSVYWKKGLHLETADKAFKLRIGGRVHNDWYWGDYDDGDFDNGVRFRRARLYLAGHLYEDVKFKWQYDFAGDGTAAWKDVYFEYTGMDLLNITIGQFKEPFGLEELTSSNDITFIERSPATNVGFVPSRQTGIMFDGDALESRFFWQIGWFYTQDDAFGDAENNEDGDEINGEWDFSARVTGLPWYGNNGAELLHLGVAFTHREYDDSPTRYRARGSWSKGDRLVDTHSFIAEDSDILGLETAIVYGPASLQGEYFFATVDAPISGDHDLQAGYLQASYILTGEHRTYKNGVFGSVIPDADFSLSDGGSGAWEVAARYSYVDLDDELSGGRLDDIAFGVNWYLNPNTRVMANYAHAGEDGDGAGEEGDILTLRLQLSF